MSDYLIIAFLFIAIVIGFFLGRLFDSSGKSKKRALDKGCPRNKEYNWFQGRYFEGLTQLLNDDADEAVDTFISVMEVNSETLETHLALGSLMRKRGELARSVKVHQNLLARPNLSKHELHTVQLELGVDYLRSGLLDRAESLLKELSDGVRVNKSTRDQATELLVEVYQDMGDWLAAIDRSDRLTTKKFSQNSDVWRRYQAFFACELAEQAFNDKDWLGARRWARNALRYDKMNARALSIQAEVDLADNDFSSALVSLKQAAQRAPHYLPDIMPSYTLCVKSLHGEAKYLDSLRALYAEYPSLYLLSVLEKSVREIEGDLHSVELLLAELPKYSDTRYSFQGTEAAYKAILFYQSYESGSPGDTEPADKPMNFDESESGESNESRESRESSESSESSAQEPPFCVEAMYQLVDRLVFPELAYQCAQCGYDALQLHWRCPSCKTWGNSSALMYLPKTDRQ